MPPEPTTAPTPAAKAPEPFRMPKVRHAMHILVPIASGKDLRIIVAEERDGVALLIDKPDSSLRPEPVRLHLTEARKLAEHLNAVCNRIAKRPEYMP